MLAPVCVFIYLTNEALKSEGRIHGIFITRNFLKEYLGQRIIFDGGYEFKFMYITFAIHNYWLVILTNQTKNPMHQNLL